MKLRTKIPSKFSSILLSSLGVYVYIPIQNSLLLYSSFVSAEERFALGVVVGGRLRFPLLRSHSNPSRSKALTLCDVMLLACPLTKSLYCLLWHFTHVESEGLGGKVAGTLQFPVLRRKSLSSESRSDHVTACESHTNPISLSFRMRESVIVDFFPS